MRTVMRGSPHTQSECIEQGLNESAANLGVTINISAGAAGFTSTAARGAPVPEVVDLA